MGWSIQLEHIVLSQINKINLKFQICRIWVQISRIIKYEANNIVNRKLPNVPLRQPTSLPLFARERPGVYTWVLQRLWYAFHCAITIKNKIKKYSTVYFNYVFINYNHRNLVFNTPYLSYLLFFIKTLFFIQNLRKNWWEKKMTKKILLKDFGVKMGYLEN